MSPSPKQRLDDLRQEALDAARGVEDGEAALVDVLRDLEQERSRAAAAYQAVVRSLAAALEARDGYTGEHSDAVHELSIAVAHRLGLHRGRIAEVEAVAVLHDVGKIGVPDHVLHKPGKLDDAEWDLMRQHPVIGERILRPLPGLEAIATAVRHEHERWDGGGYPDGLAGEAIPLASRIVLACDAYHALVSDRPYREALGEDAARAELRRCAGTQFDPAVIDALMACLEHPDERVAPMSSDDLATVLSGRTREGEAERLERELHALIAVASAVGAAHRLDDVVDAAAEAAREAIGATSVSVSAWDRSGRVIRTLVNAGELAEGEERRPRDEAYPLDGDDAVRRFLHDGTAYRFTRDDPGIPAVEQRVLVELDRLHCAGVPIMFAGQPWGELWASRGHGEPPFEERDERFLTTIAGQIAAAVGRAELFARMAELAFEDPLTGVANRRALDERLDEAVGEALAAGRDLTVVLCDLDNLKELNDAHGHAGGDAALITVASTLAELAASSPGALVARIGGDEFGVLLEGANAAEGRKLGERLLTRLRDQAREGAPLTVSCGVASLGLGARRSGDLLRAADQAQYTAKRSGRARVTIADLHVDDHFLRNANERRAYRRLVENDTAIELAALLEETVGMLDGELAGRPIADRLEAVMLGCAESVDATAVALSWAAPGGLVETLYSGDRRSAHSGGRLFAGYGETYKLSDFPLTERVMTDGGTFRVVADDPHGDPEEARLLHGWGMSEVLAAGAPGPDGERWLVEIYADAGTSDLGALEAPLRLLVAEAARGARRSGQSLRSVG